MKINDIPMEELIKRTRELMTKIINSQDKTLSLSVDDLFIIACAPELYKKLLSVYKIADFNLSGRKRFNNAQLFKTSDLMDSSFQIYDFDVHYKLEKEAVIIGLAENKTWCYIEGDDECSCWGDLSAKEIISLYAKNDKPKKLIA